MAVIAVGGLQHETNTFSPHPATFDDFAEPGGWPALCEGEAMREAVAGTSVPAAGFIAEAERLGHRIVPLAWAGAGPSGAVTDDAFERLAGLLLRLLDEAGPVDAVYLDLHGAMVTAGHDDGEAELLARMRRIVGARPLVASLDLHANVSDAMVEAADLLVAYRTYPHVDMPATGARTARALDRLLRNGTRPAKRHRKPGFLIPIPWQATVMEPARSLYERLEELERETRCALSLCMGFPAADVPFCGPSVLGHGDDPTAVDRAVEVLRRAVEDAIPAFSGRIWSPGDAVREAARLLGSGGGRPVILADVQDNPGAGGTADTTGILEALDGHGGADALVVPIADPAAAARAHEAGTGGAIEVALGGHHGPAGVRPFQRRFVVEALGDGRFTATGPMFGGNRCDLGPMALLRVDRASGGAVRIVVTSRRMQAADQAMIRHLGVEPAEVPVLVLKSSVHFRADFAPMAREILVVASPGLMPVDPATLPFRRLRPGVRPAPAR